MTIRLCWIITDRKVTNHPSSMLEWTETDVVWNWAFIKLHNKSYLVRGYRNSRCFYLTQFKIFSLSAHTHTPPLSVSIHKRRTDSWWCWPPPTHTQKHTHLILRSFVSERRWWWRWKEKLRRLWCWYIIFLYTKYSLEGGSWHAL